MRLKAHVSAREFQQREEPRDGDPASDSFRQLRSAKQSCSERQPGTEAHESNRDWAQELVIYIWEPSGSDPQCELDVFGSK